MLLPLVGVAFVQLLAANQKHLKDMIHKVVWFSFLLPHIMLDTYYYYYECMLTRLVKPQLALLITWNDASVATVYSCCLFANPCISDTKSRSVILISWLFHISAPDSRRTWRRGRGWCVSMILLFLVSTDLGTTPLWMQHTRLLRQTCAC